MGPKSNLQRCVVLLDRSEVAHSLHRTVTDSARARRLPGHPGLSLANIQWSMATKHNASSARRTTVPLWLDSTSESIIFIARFFLSGKISFLKTVLIPRHLSFLRGFVSFSHPNCPGLDIERTSVARWISWNIILWDHEFPRCSDSVVCPSLTLLYWAVLALCFWDAVWAFQGVLLVLLSLFVGRFHWGREGTLMKKQKVNVFGG